MSAATAVTGAAGWAALRDALPPPRPWHPLDVMLGVSLVIITVAALVPPPTRQVKLVRAALVPLVVGGWLYLGYVPKLRTPHERWGSSILFVSFIFRAIELLLVFPPETHVYRLIAAPGPHADPDNPLLIPEPVPPGWTRAKAEWALSLVWSWRGIGWCYAAALASSMRMRPYTRTSSRVHYLVHRSIYLLAVYAADDLAGSYMRLVAPDFFITCTTPYSALNIFERAFHSIATVTRIVCSIEYSHIGLSLTCVAAGGLFDIDSELTSPWGWPPAFGSLGSIWSHPGLSYMWSRAWNQYYRRVLHLWAWVLIGEKLLGLPVSGAASSAVSRSPGTARLMTSNSTQVSDGDDDDDNDYASNKQPRRSTAARAVDAVEEAAHPAPPTTVAPRSRTSSQSPPPAPQRKEPNLLANLLKSAIVFFFSGVVHDYGSAVMLLDAAGRGDVPEQQGRWPVLFALTPFFVIQPVGIAVEAVVRKVWRGWKRRLGLVRPVHVNGGGNVNGNTNGKANSNGNGASSLNGNGTHKPTPRPSYEQPAWLTTLERMVGWAWTWVWLGWTAKPFVIGMARVGVWRPWDGYVYWSGLGWVWGVLGLAK